MAPIQMYAPSPVQEQSSSRLFSEDNQCYKIVVDVEAFMASGVRFDVVNENELIIESCAENGEGNSASRKGFYRRFLFPSLVSVDTVRSVLSRDGILTITVAKKKARLVCAEHSRRRRMDSPEMEKTS
ncbi:Protein lethal(2)essential for life [Penaeus vannamei]|uniref:Protein lethal(2)essential for life n=1 Tax=Penaeus vannamei TaxID=6689 RepID=A0A3R7NRX1_PENVA|nr:Protein lethal(2)essential for life [Penaeus vannamei]